MFRVPGCQECFGEFPCKTGQLLPTRKPCRKTRQTFSTHKRSIHQTRNKSPQDTEMRHVWNRKSFWIVRVTPLQLHKLLTSSLTLWQDHACLRRSSQWKFGTMAKQSATDSVGRNPAPDMLWTSHYEGAGAWPTPVLFAASLMNHGGLSSITCHCRRQWWWWWCCFWCWWCCWWVVVLLVVLLVVLVLLLLLVLQRLVLLLVSVLVAVMVVMVVVSCLSLARETNKDQPAMVNYLHSTLYNKSIVLHSIYTCMPPRFFFKENLSPWIQYLTSGSAMKVPIISMAPLEGGSINLTWKKTFKRNTDIHLVCVKRRTLPQKK